jgi:hypothetical protein
MNALNRVIVIVLVLIAMIVCPLILIAPEQAEQALRYGADLVDWNLEWLDSLTAPNQMGMRLVLAVAGLIVFLLGLLFLVLELFRSRRGTVKLKDESGELMIDSISGHLAYHIDLLPDVLRVKPKVNSKGKSVRADLYVETSPTVSVPAKSAEIREKAREVIEQQLGLEIDREIRVVIRPISYAKSRRSMQRRIGRGPAPVQEPEPAPEKAPSALAQPAGKGATALEFPEDPQTAGFFPLEPLQEALKEGPEEASDAADETPRSTVQVKGDPHDV